MADPDPDRDRDRAEDQLAALATRIRLPEPADDLADRVLRRVAEPAPRARLGGAAARLVRAAGRRLGRAWRWLVGGLVVILVVVGVVPPVRAQVTQWFVYLGVIVRTPAPGAPVASGTPSPPVATPGLTVAQAASMVTFSVRVPTELGEPDGVEVSADRRIVAMSWSTAGGTVHLDQFDGTLDPVFVKTAADATRVEVGDASGLWFPSPHPVVIRDAQSVERTVPPRLAAPTLVWQKGRTTLRLEGDLTLARALAVARSAR